MYAEDFINGSILAMFGGLIFLIFAIGIAFYIVNSLALQKMATKLNIDNPWMAWIPLANIFLLGKVAGDRVVVFGKEISNLGVVLLVTSLVYSFTAAIPLVGIIILIAYFILFYSTYFKIYKIFNESSATLFLVLSIIPFTAIIQPFLMLACSKKEPNIALFNEMQEQGSVGNYEYSDADETDYEYEYDEDSSNDDDDLLV